MERVIEGRARLESGVTLRALRDAIEELIEGGQNPDSAASVERQMVIGSVLVARWTVEECYATDCTAEATHVEGFSMFCAEHTEADIVEIVEG